MEKANVYFTNMRVKAFGENLLGKLEKLMRKAGIEQIDFKDRFAAIKIHFGEYGNLSFLRPNFARTVAEEVKRLGGKPFLTDCNTLYVGSRKHALEHIETAYRNGFTPYSTGCHIIIGDGLKGTDEVSVPVPNGEYVREAKIGRAVMDADIFISLNHFKGHEMTGFGGAIKNIGMGCGSRAGKMEQHCDGKPTVNQELCIGCRNCAKICAHDAPVFHNKKATIDHAKCVGCGRCIGVCPKDAIEPSWGQAEGLVDKKMAEYALAVVNGRPHFHISIVMDVSPFCDCHPENDAPIVPNVGMFASFDPVALDQACADAVNRQHPVKDSVLGESEAHFHDHFKNVSPSTNWELQLDHAEKIGLGTRSYNLIEI
jgi:4Fe-4S ferredoxin iron-sulfur binding domain protein